MTAIDHEITGALIAVAIKEPWLAVPLAFISHFVMDALPHWWIQVEDGDVKARNAKLMYKIVTRTDFILSAAAIVILPWILRGAVSWWVVLLCVIAATIPDYYWVYTFFRYDLKGVYVQKKGLVKFHKQIQKLERTWALPVDITWFVAGAILIGVVR